MIYMDQAATSLVKPPCVVEAVVEAMTSLGNPGRGVHEHSLKASRCVYGVREQLATFFHAEDPSRIAFTSNSTESLNIAIKGIFQPGDHVITTVMEHNSVLRPLYEMEENGVQATYVGEDDLAYVSYDAMESAVQEHTVAIVCTHASNLTGNMIDLYRVHEICQKYGLLLVVDASQTAGIYPIDVQKMGIDILCFTGHKGLLGPQGTGGIYVRSGVEIRHFKTGGSGILTFDRKHPEQMPEALEAGTLNGHGIAGLGAALTYIEEVGIDAIREKELDAMWYFYQGIKEIPGIRIYGDFSTNMRCPVVACNIRDYDSSEVADALYDEYDISVRAGGHCAPLMHEALGTREQGAVRFSFSSYTTREELDIAIKAMKELAEE